MARRIGQQGVFPRDLLPALISSPLYLNMNLVRSRTNSRLQMGWDARRRPPQPVRDSLRALGHGRRRKRRKRKTTRKRTTKQRCGSGP